PISRHGRRINDRRTRLHVRQSRTRQQEHAEKVGPESTLELLRIDFFELLAHMLFGSIVHKNIQTAKCVDSLVDDLVAMRLLANVASLQLAASTLLHDQAARFYRICVLMV